MQLSDLFVSHKQVDPVVFKTEEPSLPQPIYLNLDRAKKATTTEETEEQPSDDMTTWSTQTEEKAPTWTAATISNTDREKYWMGKFANYGLTQYQQLALLAAMNSESGLKPTGAVNQYELKHKGNTKGGWAHAGEGAIQLTHWDTKKKYIDLYNADSRRQGAKLSNIEEEYAKDSSRHISDLNDDDQALMTYLFYKPLLDKTKNETDFKNIVAEFYLQKAGRGFANSGSAYDRAIKTGEVYQQTHAKQGFTNAAKTNQFLKSLEYAAGLAKQFNYAV